MREGRETINMKNEVWEVKPIEHFYSLFFVYKYEDTVGILHEISLVSKYCDPTIFDQVVTFSELRKHYGSKKVPLKEGTLVNETSEKLDFSTNQVSITDISYDPYVEELQLKGRQKRLEHDNQ